MVTGTARTRVVLVLFALVLALAACSDDGTSDAAGDGAADQDDAAAEDDAAGDEEGAATGASAEGSGTVTIDGETVDASQVRCNFDTQEVAGQTMEVTVQAFGTTSAGDDLALDFTRFGEDSSLTGDAVDLTLGDIASPNAMTYGSGASVDGLPPVGTVTVEGSSAAVSDLTLFGDEGSEITASFDLQC